MNDEAQKVMDEASKLYLEGKISHKEMVEMQANAIECTMDD